MISFGQFWGMHIPLFTENNSLLGCIIFYCFFFACTGVRVLVSVSCKGYILYITYMQREVKATKGERGSHGLFVVFAGVFVGGDK